MADIPGWWETFFQPNPEVEKRKRAQRDYLSNLHFHHSIGGIPVVEETKKKQRDTLRSYFDRQYGPNPSQPIIETRSQPTKLAKMEAPLEDVDDSPVINTPATSIPTSEKTGPTSEDKGMPGWGSMPMNMGLLQLGAGLLAQSGWQDEDISPGQAFGRAMPGAVSSYMTGVKALQDRDLYKAKMKDILDARKRDKGLVEALPGTIDSFKGGKIKGITDERLDALKTLIPHAPQKVAAAVQNLASQASTEKVTRRFANADEIKAGIPENSLVEEDNTTGELKIVHSPIPGFETKSVDGGTVILQGKKVVGTFGTSRSAEKTDLEMADSRPWATLEKYRDTPNDPAYRAAYGKLSNRLYDVTDPNDPTRTIRVKLPLEGYPKPGEAAVPGPVTDRPTTNIEEGDVGYNALAQRLLPPGSSQGDIVAFADQLAEWNPEFPSTNLPLGQEIFTGPPQAKEQKQSTTIGSQRKATEVESKSFKFAGRMVKSASEIDTMYSNGYRPSWTVFRNLESKIKEQKTWTSRAIEEELIPGMKLSQDDKKFIRYALDFVTADLRSESGAAIKDSEIVNGLKRHFEAPTLEGTMPSNELLNTARESRINAITGMIEMSGGFYKGPGTESFMSKDKVFRNTTGSERTNELIKQFNLTPPP